MRALVLKYPGRPACRTALTAVGLWNTVDNEPITGSLRHGLVLWGKHYARNGTQVIDGVTVPKFDPLKGFWVYLYLFDDVDPAWCEDIAAALQDDIVDPPKRTLHTLCGESGAPRDRWRRLKRKFARLRRKASREAQRTALEFENSVTVVEDPALLVDNPEPDDPGEPATDDEP